MKNLHIKREDLWQFTSFAQMNGISRRVDSPTEIILLLHGLGERGKRIFRKLLKSLPETALVIAPNAPFPIRRSRTPRLDFGHSWYFYDKVEKKYFVTQDLAKYWLRDLMKLENPNSLPVTIIGFSQGGYLAPQTGNEIKETKLIIGIACEFRSTLISEKPTFAMVQIHGSNDEVVTLKSAHYEADKLKEIGIDVDFHEVENAAHDINTDIALKVKTILESYGKRSL